MSTSPPDGDLAARYRDLEKRYGEAMTRLNSRDSFSVHSIAGLDQKVVQVDENLIVAYANAPFANAVGLRKEELPGRPLSQIDRFAWGPGFLRVLVEQCRELKEDVIKERAYFDAQAAAEITIQISVKKVPEGFQILLEDRTGFADLKKRFSRYVSPRVLEAMKAQERDFEAPRRYELSVLFADLRNFTALCEKLKPEQVRETLNVYLEAMISVAEQSDAMVGKIAGDELMVICGAPLPRHDHALQAMKIALEMQRVHADLRKMQAGAGVDLPLLAVGVNSGEMVAGHIGTDRRSEYTVLGYEVNLAARLCAAAGESEIVVSAATFELARKTDPDLVRKLPPLAGETLEIGGGRRPVAVFRLKGAAAGGDIRISDVAAGAFSGIREKRIFGKYQILGEIGRGGMGIVYKAIHYDIGKVVALKILKAGDLAQEAQMKMFHREMEALAAVQHPNIIPIHDVGIIEGHRYFTMDYIDGCTLEELLSGHREASSAGMGATLRDLISFIQTKKESSEPSAVSGRVGRFRALNLNQALSITLKVLGALAHAHDRGVIHRDVKPGNIMMTKEGEPLLMDFGLARQIGGVEKTRLTQEGQVVGTPAYMSPEQAEGDKDRINEKSDLYSVGVLFYEMLTGRPPVMPTGNVIMDLRNVCVKDPEPARRLNPSVPREVELICHKALDKDPERRYRTAGAFAEDLRRYINGDPVLARPQSLLYRARKKFMKHRAVSLAGLFALLIASGFLAYWVFSTREMRGREKALAEEKAKTEARWILAYRNDFNGSTLDSSEWISLRPDISKMEYRAEGGALSLSNRGRFISASPVPGNIRVVFDAMAGGGNEICVKLKMDSTYGNTGLFYEFIWAEDLCTWRKKGKFAERLFMDRYFYRENFIENLRKRDHRWNHIEVSIIDGVCRAFVNGALSCEAEDVYPLEDVDNSRWGFSCILGTLKIDNLRVYRQLLPVKMDLTRLIDLHLERGEYAQAFEALMNIARNYDEPEVVIKVLKKTVALDEIAPRENVMSRVLGESDVARKMISVAPAEEGRRFFEQAYRACRRENRSFSEFTPLAEDYARWLTPEARFEWFVFLGMLFETESDPGKSGQYFSRALEIREDGDLRRYLAEGRLPRQVERRGGARLVPGGYDPYAFGKCRRVAPFYMDTVEVTRGLFRKITGAPVRPFRGAEACPFGPEFPAQAVSLWEAMLFCNKRSAAEGLDSCYSLKDFRDTVAGMLVYKRDKAAKVDSYFIRLDTVRNFRVREDRRNNGYRIPDLAEMEYADRAGSTRKYFWGDDPAAAPEYGWFEENSGGCAHAVGTRAANPFGLHDVSGNAMEWCFSGDDRFVIYGVGYSRSPAYVSSIYFGMDVWCLQEDVGFRCVRRAD